MSYEGYSPKINPTSSLFSNMMYHPGKWIKAHHIQAGHTCLLYTSDAADE